MKRHLIILTALALEVEVAARPVQAPAHPFPEPVAEGIAEAQGIAKRHGAKLWPGFGDVSFSFLLVEETRELLACDDRMPDGFRLAGYDKRLKCSFKIGPRSWRRPNLLAAMPIFGPPTTIVMGSPLSTGKTVPAWQLTVLHEHFHQWQSAQPGYHQRVDALGLAKGDRSGMWMLNYPFPYGDPNVAAAYSAATRALVKAIAASDDELATMTEAYLAARGALAATMSEADWRYFEFQLWQEGVARWTEIEMGERSGRRVLHVEARRLRKSVQLELEQSGLARNGRLGLYAVGAAEAMLLERTQPYWRSCYPNATALGPLLREGCAAKPSEMFEP